MGKNKIIYCLFSVLLFTQFSSLGQNKINNFQNQKKIQANKLYGFKFEYHGKLNEMNNNEYSIQINSENPNDKVYVKVDTEPSVYLPNTYGGWYYFTNKKSIQTLSSNIVSEQDTINGLVFTKEYWMIYGGEGSWDTIINSYTKYNGKYYIIALVHKFLTGMPGIIVDSKKITKKDITVKCLNMMRNMEDIYVKSFNEVLSSFSISN
jgi:hypothetical protein